MCQKGNTIACRLIPLFSVLSIGISLLVMVPSLAYADKTRTKIPIRDPDVTNTRAKIPMRDPEGKRYGIYTIQVMRPDPNRPESQSQTVQSIRMNYFFQFPVDAATASEQKTCIKTPDQNWHVQDIGKTLKFGSNVRFEVFVGSDCTGNNVTQQIYGQSSLDFQVPNSDGIKNSTCWMNMNNFPSGTVSGCNGM